MLNWLSGFIGRWAGSVDSKVRDLVHWAVHALASVVYTVFGLVGHAWSGMVGAAEWVAGQLGALAVELYHQLWAIIKRDMPWLARAITAARTLAVHLYNLVTAWAWREIRALENLLGRLINDVRQWAYRDLYLPLLQLARDARRDIQAWAVPAFFYITHPDKLAALLGDSLVTWLEANAWRVGRRLGTFTLALVMHNARQLAATVEAIVAAVL